MSASAVLGSDGGAPRSALADRGRASARHRLRIAVGDLAVHRGSQRLGGSGLRGSGLGGSGLGGSGLGGSGLGGSGLEHRTTGRRAGIRRRRRSCAGARVALDAAAHRRLSASSRLLADDAYSEDWRARSA
jgi:hypothetical protein